MPTNAVQDWGAAMMTSLTTALSVFLAAIPKIIGFLVILVVGWLIASLLARGVAALLRSVRFNDLAQRAGITDFVQRMGVKSDSAGLLASVVKWFVRLIALVVAFDALGLPAVSQVLREFLLWLPNLVVAMVVLVIGGLAARALGNLVRGAASKAQLGNPQLLARIATVAIWAFTIVVAVNQLGIAETLVNTLFMAVVGSVAIAVALAFGLGGRETAAEIVRGWRQRSLEVSDRAREAASGLAREKARAANEPAGTMPPGSTTTGTPPSGRITIR